MIPGIISSILSISSKRSDFFKYLAKKNFSSKHLRNLKKIDFHVLRRHYQKEKKTVRIIYKYKKNKVIEKKGNIKICYKLNKEFSTDRVTLSVKARPQFFDE